MAWLGLSARRYWAVGILIMAPLVIRAGVTWLAPAEFSEHYTYRATECRIDSIAYGCLLAMLGGRPLRAHRSHGVLALGLVGLLFTLLYRDPTFREVFRYSVQGLSLYLIIGTLIYAPEFEKLRNTLSMPLAVWIGKLSYSLYLYHWLALILMVLFVGKISYSLPWQAGYWLLSLGFAALSYYCIERPATSQRIRFGSVTQ